MKANDDHGADDDATPPSWLTPEEETIWGLEGFDKLPPTVSVPVAAKFLGLGRLRRRGLSPRLNGCCRVGLAQRRADCCSHTAAKHLAARDSFDRLV